MSNKQTANKKALTERLAIYSVGTFFICWYARERNCYAVFSHQLQYSQSCSVSFRHSRQHFLLHLFPLFNNELYSVIGFFVIFPFAFIWCFSAAEKPPQSQPGIKPHRIYEDASCEAFDFIMVLPYQAYLDQFRCISACFSRTCFNIISAAVIFVISLICTLSILALYYLTFLHIDNLKPMGYNIITGSWDRHIRSRTREADG